MHRDLNELFRYAKAVVRLAKVFDRLQHIDTAPGKGTPILDRSGTILLVFGRLERYPWCSGTVNDWRCIMHSKYSLFAFANSRSVCFTKWQYAHGPDFAKCIEII
jgi:hypothetical protein